MSFQQLESTIASSRPGQYIDMTIGQYERLPRKLKDRIQIMTDNDEVRYLTKKTDEEIREETKVKADKVRREAEILVDKTMYGARILDMTSTYYDALNEEYKRQVTITTSKLQTTEGLQSFTYYFKK